MPENGFSSVNRSLKEDSSQINEHLDNMSIDELTDALTDMWNATDDLTYSAAWMDECLKKIDQIETAPEFDVDASLNNFLSKHPAAGRRHIFYQRKISYPRNPMLSIATLHWRFL